MYVVLKNYDNNGFEGCEPWFLVPESNWHEFVREHGLQVHYDDLPRLAQATMRGKDGAVVNITAMHVPYYVAL